MEDWEQQGLERDPEDCAKPQPHAGLGCTPEGTGMELWGLRGQGWACSLAGLTVTSRADSHSLVAQLRSRMQAVECRPGPADGLCVCGSCGCATDVRPWAGYVARAFWLTGRRTFSCPTAPATTTSLLPGAIASS